MKMKILGAIVKCAVKDAVEDVIEAGKRVVKTNSKRYEAFKEYAIQQDAINELKAGDKKAVDDKYSPLEKEAAEKLKKNLSAIKQ